MGLKFKSKNLPGFLDYVVSHSQFKTRVELIKWLEDTIKLQGDPTLNISVLKTVALCKGEVPIAVWG